MKKQLLAVLLFIGLAFSAKAQYVTIPDANFAAWLNTNYPQCMNGNQMDTTCSAIVAEDTIGCSHAMIANMEGAEYFKNLKFLNCAYNNLSSLSALPAGLDYLICSDNPLGTLPALPASIRFLYCENDSLTFIPILPVSLQTIYCDHNSLASLPTLPVGLKHLICGNNQLSNLPALPAFLNSLSCSDNQLSYLPALPAWLEELSCSTNSLTSLPTLPVGLNYLSCGGNPLNNLPVLSDSLITLECTNNQLSNLPALPVSLQTIFCGNNSLTSLPTLPVGLVYLMCNNNQLSNLPNLPPTLKELLCASNSLSNILSLPDSLERLDCSLNNLTSISKFPETLYSIVCYSNFITCLPYLPNNLEQFQFDNSIITCLPNYPIVSGFSTVPLNSIPLCDLFNTSGCQAYWNISGKAFEDANSNCAMDANETGVSNIKCQLWSNGALVQQAYLQGSYVYSFDTDNYGNYEVTLDTTNQPFLVTCPANNIYYDTITATDSMIYNNDFAVQCKPGFDVRVYSISSYYRFRPANNSTVWINAGDASNFYNAHCAAGVAGVVTVVINGPAHYSGPANGALSPTTVNGDTVTWNVADFGIVNALTDFNIVVQTDTLAPIGSQICITVNVTPTAGDNNPANNTLTHCFNVVSSYDPNEKEVYPSGNIDTAQDWLTYTVHFQNTGTAEAQHIYVKDTLDANVDEGSFQLLAYSHQPVIQINEKIVRFNFPNINLPDSTTDEPNSHGYVQYKVKLKQHLPIGTQVSNTAYIYFDFNSPVVTNTVTNTVAVDTSVTIGIPTINKDAELAVTIYPNPANTQLTVAAGAPNGTIHIYSTEGKLLNTYAMQGTAQTINIETLASGIYYIEVTAQGQTARKKVVKL